ncbi:MAG: flagellum-specific synthase FliI [Pseudomonadota bacterium]
MGTFERAIARITSATPVRRSGTVTAISAGTVTVSGLGGVVALGDRLVFPGAAMAGGEVVAIAGDDAILLPDGPAEGLVPGQRAERLGAAGLAPDDGWIGRIVDPFGLALDGRALLPGRVARPLRAAPPPAARRGRLGGRLATGSALFDTLLPIVRGQRIGLFAGSGVGKSTLLARLARGLQADVAVIGLVGERGREVREFCEDVLGPDGMARSVVVAATSDQPPVVRRRCAWAAMAVAEHFRDQGRHVLLLLDSVTRFAEAHREIAVAAGEAAALRGYPPSVAQAIMQLAERAGPGEEGRGDITAVFSVLVAGSDMEETVADILRGVLDGHVVLDRKIAERGRFPAVDLLRSVSRSLPRAADADENALIARARGVLAAWDRAEMMVQAGLYAAGSDPAVDEAIRLFPLLDAFLSEGSAAPEAGFAQLAAILSGGVTAGGT